jgi:ADP-ribosyl-[dinitrogen reductase] hydrolase
VGFVKIAFTHAFRHLIAGSDFTLALRETLAGGGDTDTNACIVAGLIGAASGAEAIPGKQATAVLACDTTAGRHSRPAFLTTGDLRTLVENLLTP